MEGRFEEARRWLEDGFDAMTSPVETLQRLYKLDVDPFPIEGVRTALERAGKQAPEDDRVWLARAHLAIRLGEFAEAERWLERCLERRPDDPVVWRMKLECALAAGQADQVRQALPHLPAALEPEGRVPALRAWLAARDGDRQAERLALEQVDRAQSGRRPGARTAGRTRARGRPARSRSQAPPDDPRRSIEIARSTSGSWPRRRPRRTQAELARLADAAGPPVRRRALGDARRRLQPRDASQATTTGSRRPRREETAAGPTLADLLEIEKSGRRPPFEALSTTPLVVARIPDDAQAAGLNFVQENGGAPGRLIPPVTASGGVGLLDFDNDGWLDVYLVQGGPFPPEATSSSSAPGDRLFRNRGDGTFEDVTVRSGIGAMARWVRPRGRGR